MTDQSDSTSSTGPTLSQVPPIRSFEFDKKAIGHVKTGVNQFRGSVALPMDLLTLPGRPGLDVKLSAIYSSAVRNNVTTWNVEAPTGILGLGWDMPIERIMVDKAGSGTTTSDTYYLVSGGSASPMVKTGESAGRWTFQLRNYEFWSIQYDPGARVWTVVKEDGSVYRYGGSDRAAIQWAVKWGNWIGSSTEPSGQDRYPVAWNLASITSTWGHQVLYAYESVERTVGSDGLAFTQASYLHSVTDSYGRVLTFNYGEKYGELNPSPKGIVEYQARNDSQPSPNAYQDKYETRYLDRVDLADADGDQLYSIQLVYALANLAPTGDPDYPLMWKRYLASFFQYSSTGEALPAMQFAYFDQPGDVNAGALKSITYPEGGCASYRYKKNFLYAPKNIDVPNPLSGSVPGVWHGSDYVALTFCQPTTSRGINATVYSWSGQWVGDDITSGAMASTRVDPDSVQVLAQDSFIALSFRNLDDNCDEIYLYRRDPAQFGQWALYNDQPYRLYLSGTPGASRIIAGSDFVIAYNKDYSSGPFQGFSWDWKTNGWTTPWVLPTSNQGADGVAIAAVENYWIVAFYFASQKSAQLQIFYRDLAGAWEETQEWTNSGLDVVISDGQLLFAWNAQPGYAIATYVRATSNDRIDYSLRIFQWDESFYIPAAGNPPTYDLDSTVQNGVSQYEIFQTIAVGASVANNRLVLRNIGGDVDQAPDRVWMDQRFAAPSTSASVVAASGDDVAVMCVDDGGTQTNTLMTFDPNVLSAPWTTSTNIDQSGRRATVSNSYMTVGRTIYARDTQGAWQELGTRLNGLGDEESVQNRGPYYVAFQDTADGNARSYVTFLRNGGAGSPQELAGGRQKIYVPTSERTPGMALAGPRFLVSYPSSSSFKQAATLSLFNLDEADLSDYVFDLPVAIIRIDDPYNPSQSFTQSYFYANSEQSEIAYNSATGVAQYPLVYVVPAVASTDTTPPSVQPEGRSQFFYSNGLSPQQNLNYPQGWLYNYAAVLNGMLLARQDYDSDGKLVAAQLNYWKVFTNDANARADLYGGYARLMRTTNTSDGLTQDTYSQFDELTGVELWREQSYVDADGSDKVQRTQSLYAWQVSEYSQAFLAQHDYSSVAQTTTSVSNADRDDKARVYTRSESTTYRNWAESMVTAACTDPSTCRFAAYETYRWTTPGGTAPAFDFAAGGNRAAWQLERRVVKRSAPEGLVEEQVNWNEVPSSFSYDRGQRSLIGKFPGASRIGDEASYTGFEGYESDEGWQRGAGAIVVPNSTYPQVDAHLGRCSVRLQPATAGAAGLRRTFRPQRQDQRYVFSAWVKLPTGFDSAKGQARWHIVVSGGAMVDLAFSTTVGRWTYVSQAIDLPGAGGASIEITAENANTQSYVLVDDLRFTPVSCPFQGSGYDTRFWVTNGSLGANGEAARTVYDAFQQPVFNTNAGDALDKMQASYLSRSGNAAFAVADPNADLKVRAAGQGELTGFTRGDEWKTLWVPQPGVWEVAGTTLTQTKAGTAGTLAIADARYRAQYAVAVELEPTEDVTQPAGLRLGTALTVRWQPQQLAWELIDGNGVALARPVGGVRFEFPAPSGGALDAKSAAAHFHAAGTPLAAGATVTPDGAGRWTVTDAGGARFALVQHGNVIKVAPLGWRWLALVGTRSFAFWVDGRCIFSYRAAAAFDAAPEFFFGMRVAIAYLAAGTAPQANIAFQDPNGNAIQLQQFVDDRAIVSQTVSDDQGRAAVRTKAAYVEYAQNPPFVYCADFARFDWATGKMSGLVAKAYPDDRDYPFSREVYETSPLGRVVAQGMPGEQFRVGAHATTIAYGTTDMRIGAKLATYSRITIVNPNNDTSYQISNQLAQVLCKVSLQGGGELRNVTIFDAAANPVELRAPNYYAPPAGSIAADWVTAQAFNYAGQPISVKAGKLAATTVVYDAGGNLRFSQDPQGAQQGYFSYRKYDRVNRVLESGYVTGTWNRDDLQRIATTDGSWPPTPATWRKKFSYDDTDPASHGLGRVHRVQANNADAGNADVTETFAYTLAGSVASLGLLVPEFDSTADNRVDYGYDNVGNITRITYPPVAGNRFEVHYGNNALNQVVAIAETEDFVAPLAGFAYGASGRMETRTLSLAGSGAATTVEHFAFNSPLWISGLRAEKPSGDRVFEEALTYTEDGYGGAAYYDGTVASAHYQVGGATPKDYEFKYSYSSLGQVQNAQASANSGWDLGVVAPVSYDANGNFVAVAQGGAPRSYSYNPGTDQVQKITNLSGGATVADCTYNANGDAITFNVERFGAIDAHRLTIGYDRGTRMTARVADTGGATVDFIYAGGDERVLKRVTPAAGPVARKLYVRGTNALPLVELARADAGVSATQYIFGPGGIIALRRDGASYGVMRDHLGSVRAVVDAKGDVVASYDYLTFGTPAVVNEPSPGFMPYLFTGQELDWEIGLYNYRARLFSGALGRFLATDPGRQYFSPYIYAANNPVLYIDPSGRWSIGSLFSAIGGFIVGVVEVLAGVVVDVVAGVVEALSLGAATPLSVALAMTAGALYGAGASAITYSVFNAGDFSWKEYGIEMGIGAVAGFLTAGFGALGGIAAEAATGVKAAVEAGEQVSRLARAGSFVIENGITIAGGAATEVLTTTLKDVAAGVTPGADLADAALWSVVGGVVDVVVPGAPDYKAGWGNLGKRTAATIGRSALIDVSVNTAANLAGGNPWDEGLANAVFGAALSGSLGGLQVKEAAKDTTSKLGAMWMV
jgi:large repetitive protein